MVLGKRHGQAFDKNARALEDMVRADIRVNAKVNLQDRANARAPRRKGKQEQDGKDCLHAVCPCIIPKRPIS